MVKTLVVDDTEDTRLVLSQMIEQVGGRVVGQVASGAEALTWLEQQGVDLVLTDFQMPAMRGDILVSRIRAQWPMVRIAMISVLADADIAARAQAAGVHWLLSKPVTLAQLEQVVRGAVSHNSRWSEDPRA